MALAGGHRIPQAGDMRRVDRLREQLADARGGRVVLLSHCLLNENVRYLGGAGRAGGVGEVVDGYLARGVGICQLPCPEQRAWGGVLKRRMLVAYGSAGTARAPMARLLLRPFIWYTRLVYAWLARAITGDVADYRRCGVEVVGLVGIGGSPSCGVATTLDLPGAVHALTRCPVARLDRRALNEDIIAANVRPGEGLFVRALRRRLARAGVGIPMAEHDLLAELGISCRRGQRPREAGVGSRPAGLARGSLGPGSFVARAQASGPPRLLLSLLPEG
jgi:predicted secreted protein